MSAQVAKDWAAKGRARMGAHTKLIHVGLAGHYGTVGYQVIDDGGIEGRCVVSEYLRGSRGPERLRGYVVFDGHRLTAKGSRFWVKSQLRVDMSGIMFCASRHTINIVTAMLRSGDGDKGIQVCVLCLTLNALLDALQGLCRHGPCPKHAIA